MATCRAGRALEKRFEPVGHRRIAAASNYAAGTGPRAMDIGDFNGDGKMDLAVADQSGNSVSILLGNGSGGFAAPASYAVGSSPVSIVAADFNNDGKLDLAVANFGGNVSVLLGNGHGVFAAAATYAAG